VFLGLLGTFWGLLETITSVGRTISSLDTQAAESVMVFEELKSGLAAPLKGMGTAFSSSLLGLSGSLVLGFLELQASQSQNRFYNELEEWLSGITELTPATGGSAEQLNRQIYTALFEVQRSLSEIADRMEQQGLPAGTGGDAGVQELADGVHKLIDQMRSEQKIVREWIDEQAQQSGELTEVLKTISAALPRGR